MKKTLLTLLLIATAPCFAIKGEPFLFGPRSDLHVIVNNRILAKVNGNAISVLDVMKKMDVMFYRQFPQYSSNPQARYQFYQVNWKHVLQELIDKELVMADAQEVKMQVTAGDIRQEMETLFGPNIVGNLDKIGLTFEEAWEMVKSDIMIKRMMFYRVNGKAIKSVTPKEVRAKYEEMAAKNVIPTSWTYTVITIRGEDSTESAELANLAYQLLTEENISLGALPSKLKQRDSSASFSISEPFNHTENEVSPAYKEILTTLQPATFSHPIAQTSRNKSVVFRIFNLHELKKGGAVPFVEVENKIKDKLIDEAVKQQTERYLTRLYRHFDVHESHLKQMVPEDFQPFALQ